MMIAIINLRLGGALRTDLQAARPRLGRPTVSRAEVLVVGFEVAKLEAAVVAAVVAAVEVDAMVATPRDGGGKTRPPPPPRNRFKPSSFEGSLAGGWPRRIRRTALRRQGSRQHGQVAGRAPSRQCAAQFSKHFACTHCSQPVT